MPALGAIFTYLMSAIGIGLGAFYPFVGLMVYYLFSILRPPDLWFWVASLRDSRLSLYVALPTIIGWGIAGFGSMRNYKYMWFPMTGLMVYMLAGVFAWQFTAINKVHAGYWLQTQLKIILMCVMTMALVTNEKRLKTFAWVILFGLGYLAWNFNETYLTGFNRVFFNGFGGTDNNGIALIMVMGVPLAFFLGLNVRSWLVRGACLLASLLMVHVVLFNFSRGGQLGLCMVGAMLFGFALIRLPRKGLTVGLGIVAVLVTLRLAGAEVRDEFMSIFVHPEELDASAASRFDTWSAAFRCMLDHPLGVGPRCFNLISDHYGLTRGKSVHNLFLQTGADYGFIGMIALFCFYAGAMWQTFQMTRLPAARQMGWPTYFGTMTCISLGGFMICSTFIGIESLETGYIIAMLGLCTVAYVRDQPQTAARPSQAIDIPELEQVPV